MSLVAMHEWTVLVTFIKYMYAVNLSKHRFLSAVFIFNLFFIFIYFFFYSRNGSEKAIVLVVKWRYNCPELVNYINLIGVWHSPFLSRSKGLP